MRGWLYWRRKMLVVAEREAQIEAYMDLARPIYQLLHQLVPMNEKLGRAQIAHYLPPLYLPDWNRVQTGNIGNKIDRQQG